MKSTASVFFLKKIVTDSRVKPPHLPGSHTVLAAHDAKQWPDGCHNLWQVLQTSCIFSKIRRHALPARQDNRAQYPNTTHAVPSKGFHPCAAPSALQNKV